MKLSPQEAAKELLRRRKARTNFASFCEYLTPEEPPAEHHRLLCDKLDDVLAGIIPRLMVFMPPGSAKSTYATVKFPAYVMGRWELDAISGRGVITGSYGQDLANNFGRKVRSVVRSSEYQDLFPETSLSQHSQSK